MSGYIINVIEALVVIYLHERNMILPPRTKSIIARNYRKKQVKTSFVSLTAAEIVSASGQCRRRNPKSSLEKKRIQ